MNRLTAALALVLPCLLVVSSAAQDKPRAAAGVITGTLTGADRGRPLRKAHVKLVSTSPQMVRTTTSDAEGKYLFERLPPGDYTLSASKAGYLEMTLGARRPGAGVPGTRLALGAGQRLDDVSLALPRGGVISGIVTDEFGDPAMGVPVRIMRFGYTNGHRMARPVASAVTDDIGGYRVGGLAPGEYVVSAVPRDSVAAAAASAAALEARLVQIRAAGGETERAASLPEMPGALGYVPASLGHTPSPSAAARIPLGLSEHAGGIDIQLVSLSTGTVSGIVTDPAGMPTAASVQLLDPLLPIANMTVWFRHPGADGRFSFRGLVPGTYVLRAQGTRPIGEVRGSAFTGAMEVQVTEGGTVEGALRLQRGVTVAGRLDLDTLRTPADLQRLRVELRPITGPADWEAALPRATPNAAGRFSLPNVVPGAYRVRVSGLPREWRVASAAFGDVDAADVNLVVKAAEPVSGGVVTFTSRSSGVSGTLSNANGEPVNDRAVILFPIDQAFWVADSRRIHLAQPGADGRYSFAGLPAGTYRLAAIDPPEPGEQFDPEFLAQLVFESAEVAVGEGETRTRDLRVK